jgi:hypothetical protein
VADRGQVDDGLARMDRAGTVTLEMDPRLRAIADSLENTRWGAELWDSEWRLAWVSEETRAVLGDPGDEALGIGRHVLEVRFNEPWVSTVDENTRHELLEAQLGYIAHDTPGGVDRVTELLEQTIGFSVPFEAVPPPTMWARRIRLTLAGQPAFPVQFLAVRLTGDDGAFLGTCYVYGSTLPARLIAFVTRGNEDMFRRMAALVEPGRRSAAVLFADLQASGTLSRKLPSAAYFELIRSLTTEMDRAVIANDGIVGKHAGDGVTAFFLPEDLGSHSAAAAAAIRVACGRAGDPASRAHRTRPIAASTPSAFQ